MEFQDIIAQRLRKVENFLIKIDKIVDSKETKKFLKDFAWEKEITQDDVDEILKKYGV